MVQDQLKFWEAINSKYKKYQKGAYEPVLKGLLIIFIGIIPQLLQAQDMQKMPVDYINPLIGTALNGEGSSMPSVNLSLGMTNFASQTNENKRGGTMPSVNPPFAMTNFVAQTNENKISRMPYLYEDSTIIGFLATHQPTVWMGDYGYVSIMPGIGKLKTLPEERKLSFNHHQEQSNPYYYSAVMETSQGKKLKAEIAASERSGLFRFTFPQAEQAHIVVQGINLKNNNDQVNSSTDRYNQLSGYVHINQNKKEIAGYNPDRMSFNLGPKLKNFKGYFVIKFDKSFKQFGTWDNDSVYASNTELTAKRMGAYISFKTRKDEKINVKIGTSFISVEQARENLRREIPGWNFKQVVKETRSKWQQALDRIHIQGVSEDKKAIFYTAMFHTLLFPRNISEYGHYYSAFDDTVHKGISYNDYSLWDTFRALHPLLIFTQPDRVNPIISSLVQMYKQGGWLPKWPNPTYSNIMIGTHADAVIADAYVKGFRDYNIPSAYAALRKDAFVPPNGDRQKRWGDRDIWSAYEARGGLSYYKSLGYVPVDKTNESVSRTLEFAYDDFCVAQLAKALGKSSDYKTLMARSRNYRNVYNDSTGFMAPRKSNGYWADDPNKGFTEGSKWNYLFGVMHDIPGLVNLMGKKRFIAKLDSTFAGHHFRYDNEPGNHYTYLYDYIGQPWNTQKLVRDITTLNYHNGPAGINGNDDLGQMSAWYIFSVMGFYPVTPGSGTFAIGAPQFPKIVMQLGPKGNTHPFTIRAKNLTVQNKYIQSVTLDGEPLRQPFINYKDIMNSQKLVFVMGSTPNEKWK